MEVLAKEHGGNAGAVGNEEVKSEEKKEEESETTKGELGSGEKLVHASGLAADGGDFDASKPGAGREADRKFFPVPFEQEFSCVENTDGMANEYDAGLMEERGIDHGEKDGKSGSGSGKRSLKDRIKAKFHKS